MSLSILQKLVMAFVGLTLLILVATLSLAQWSFEKGFLDYVNALEQARLQFLSTILADEYIEADENWNNVSKGKIERLLAQRPGKAGRPEPEPMPPPPPSLNHPLLDFLEDDDFEMMTMPPRGKPQPPVPTALLNNNEVLVAGNTFEKEWLATIRVPVMVKGAKVGELRSEPRRHIASAQETAFSRQQRQTSIVIGAACLLLATLISLLLAKVLLAPIRRMLSGIEHLSKGDYSIRLNDDRRDELGRLMGDFNHLAYTLEENQSSRRRWLANISHELRTPLTILTAEIEALKDGVRELDGKQLDSFDQEVKHLRYLVDDLNELSLSDLGGLRYEFAETNIIDCIDASLSAMQSQALASGIEVKWEEKPKQPIWVNADAQRVNQLFVNLINNSLAYTDAPGKVVLTVSTNHQQVNIMLDDTPLGVDASECEKLFEPLYRRDSSRSRHNAGAGLGLAICRNIVEAHRGQISASPSPLGGLRIHIALPRKVSYKEQLYSFVI